MKHPFRRLVITTGFLIILMCFIYVPPLFSRSVVVVYDDSKSMEEEDRWFYANYAMQALTALISEDDNLFVIRMSEPENPIDFNKMDKNIALKKIFEEFTPQRGTPYQSVRTAINLIYDFYDDDIWLIILSDGEFNEEWDPERYGSLDMDELEFEISDFIAETGTKTIFLLIGNEKLADRQSINSWKQNAQANIMTADSRREITAKMQYIAEQVTSRSKGKIGIFQNHTLTIDTPFPLRRLTLLDQNSSYSQVFQVDSAEDSNGDKMVTNESFTMQTPYGSPEIIQSKLTHIRERREDQVIPEGSISIQFKNEINPESILILPDVALSFEVFLTDAGGERLSPDQKGIYTIYEDQEIVVNGQLVHQGTGEPVELRKIADEIDKLKVITFYNSEDPVQLELVNPGEALFTNKISFPEGEHHISASAEFPGYFNFKSNVFTIKAEHYYRTLGIEPIQDWSGSQLKLGESSVLIRPQADGLTISEDEFKQWPKPKISSPNRIWFELEPVDRGWLIKPRPYMLEPLFTSTGIISVEFELLSNIPGETGHGAVTLTIEASPVWKVAFLFITKLLVIIFLIWYINGIVKRPRFAKKARIEAYKNNGTVGDRKKLQTIPLKPGIVSRIFVPYLPERKRVNSHWIFEAVKSREDMILFKASTLRKTETFNGDNEEYLYRKGFKIFTQDENSISRKSGKNIIEYNYKGS